MTSYLFLMGAIILEVAGTLMLPLSQNTHAPAEPELFKTYSDCYFSHSFGVLLLSFDTRGEGYTPVGSLCYMEWSRRVLSSHHGLRPLWRLTQVASNSWFISNCWRCGIGQHF